MNSILTGDRRRMLRAGFTRTVVAAAFAAITAPSAFAQLNRTGPVGPLGYPEWYQDKSGLTLEFCDNRTQAELEGGWCVLLPPDLATGAAPETRTGSPVNFADEHFYYLVNAGAAGVTTSGSQPFRVLLVAAIEGAFGGGPVKAGDEMVFARLRVRVDPVPYSGTYTVYTPFGKRVFEDQVAGDRLFVTDDVGLTVGNFQEALNGSIYPFLVPSATPGGPELPPVSATNPTPDTNPLHFGGGAPTPYPGNGRRYIGDPARIGPITGSVANFTADGIADPHLFRIDVSGPDVPGGHQTIYQTVDFTVSGRIFEGAMPGNVTIDRTSYSRGGTTGDKVDVFATATPITKGRVPGEASTPPIPSSLVYYNAACKPTLDLAGNPGAPYQAPANAAKVTLLNRGTTFFGQYGTLPNGLDGCLEANATTTNGQATTVYMPLHLSDQLTISDATFDATAQTLTVHATSSDATVGQDGVTPIQTLTVPGFGNLTNGQLVVGQVLAVPATIAVTSSGGGSNTHQVTTGVPSAAGTGTTTTTPPAQPVAPIATNVAAATIENQPTTFTLTTDTTMTVALVTNPVLGTATVSGGTVTYTPNLNASGNDAFAYTLQSAGLTSNTATVTIAIAPVNNAPTAVAESMNAIAGVANNFNLLGNDTDPDGQADLASIVVDSADARLGTVTSSGGTVTFTPQAQAAGATDIFVTYHAVDRTGTASPSVSDNVRVFASESIVPSKWQYTTSQNRWVVTGTVSPNQAQTMTITYASGSYNVWNTAQSKFACTGNPTGQLVGKAVTDGTATWTFDQGGTNPNSILNPTNSNNNAVSPDGRTKTSFWCTTPTLRITSSATGASVTTSAVQIK
jgi:hypothetical protein